MAYSSFGFGTPFTPQTIPSGGSFYGLQGWGLNPYAVQQGYGQAGLSLYGLPPFQQMLQLFQIVPQQLQQLHQLVFAQHQQLQQAQQVIQVIPAQLAQLQQLIQIGLQQIPQLSTSQLSGFTGFGAASPWGLSPQTYAQPGLVM